MGKLLSTNYQLTNYQYQLPSIKIMALPKIAEARSLSDSELSDKIIEIKRQLFQLRLLQGTGRMEKPHLFKHAKHQLAQLLTVETERQLAKAQTAATPE